jgi:hypothetical protein
MCAADVNVWARACVAGKDRSTRSAGVCERSVKGPQGRAWLGCTLYTAQQTQDNERYRQCEEKKHPVQAACKQLCKSSSSLAATCKSAHWVNCQDTAAFAAACMVTKH